MRIDSAGNLSLNGKDNRHLNVTSYDTNSVGAGWDFNASSSNGEITLSTAGAERLSVDNLGHVTLAEGGKLYLKSSTAPSPYMQEDNQAWTVNTGSAERMRIDANGKVGIGTDAPVRKLETSADNNGGTKANYIRITDTDTSATAGNYQGGIEFYTNDAGNEGVTASIENVYAGSGGGSQLTFNVAPNGGAGVSEAMRIDASGNLLVGTTSNTIGIGNYGTRINPGDGSTLRSYRNGGATTACVAFGGSVGEVIVRGDGDLENTNNSYGGISDARLKSDIVDASSQLDDIMAVKVRSYTLDSTGATHIGVVAQELEEAGMHGLVSENDEGMKSVKYSLLYMKAIKAMQEQQAMIEALKAEVEALKNA
jgi:hypothetical protein